MNFKIILTKYRLHIFIILLVLMIVAILVSNFRAPKIIETIPLNAKSSVGVNSPLTIVFDKNISSNIMLESSPPELFDIEYPGGNTLVATHSKSFLQNTDYTIKILYHNKFVGTLVFTTEQLQNNPRVLQELDDYQQKNYPLANKTPLKTENSQTVYVAPLLFEIQLYEDNLSQDEILSQVRKWVASQGIDPDSHDYVFRLPSHPAPRTIK